MPTEANVRNGASGRAGLTGRPGRILGRMRTQGSDDEDGALGGAGRRRAFIARAGGGDRLGRDYVRRGCASSRRDGRQASSDFVSEPRNWTFVSVFERRLSSSSMPSLVPTAESMRRMVQTILRT